MYDTTYDIIVVGCGPAGLSAAFNAAIRRQKVLVLGSEVCSPRLRKAPRISNYLGLQSLSGQEIIDLFVSQTLASGVQFENRRVESIIPADDIFYLTAGEDVLSARSVILATGIPYRPTLKGEADFVGSGVAYCATCDGALFQGQTVAVIGHSVEAENEASFLADICSRVYYIPRYEEIGHLDQRIELVYGTPIEIKGGSSVTSLKLKDRELAVNGVFILGIEAAPDRLVPGLDMEDNHIMVNRQMETNIPGLFAAGDCTGAPYQISKAVGEGQVAGLSAARYIESQKK